MNGSEDSDMNVSEWWLQVGLHQGFQDARECMGVLICTGCCYVAVDKFVYLLHTLLMWFKKIDLNPGKRWAG